MINLIYTVLFSISTFLQSHTNECRRWVSASFVIVVVLDSVYGKCWSMTKIYIYNIIFVLIGLTVKSLFWQNFCSNVSEVIKFVVLRNENELYKLNKNTSDISLDVNSDLRILPSRIKGMD